jgi:transmembrane sensor
MTTPFNTTFTSAANHESSDILQQATQWYAHFQSGEADKADYQAFEQWKSAHPEHDIVYQKLASMWSRIESLDASATKATINAMLPNKRKGSVRKAAGGLLGLAFVLVASWFSTQSEFTQYYLADHRSSIGEQPKIILSDSSKVLLDTHSAINVHFNQQKRSIELVKGALFVDVAKDAKRPLIVETEFGSAQAMGTQFSVEKASKIMTVSVKESHVKVCTKDDQSLCVTLAPGEEADVFKDHISSIRQIDPTVGFAWIKGSLIADNLPLQTVLERLNKYKVGKLSYDADDLQNVRVSGVLKLTDVNQTLMHISQTVPIEINTYTSYWTTIRSK